MSGEFEPESDEPLPFRAACPRAVPVLAATPGAGELPPLPGGP